MEPDQVYLVVRQIVTHAAAYLILLAILKALVWKPFLNLIDERSRKISEEFQKADDAQAKFEALRADYEQRIKDIQEDAQAKINEAVAKGQQLRDEILAKANKDAADVRDRVERETRAKLDAVAIEMKERIVAMTMRATEKILREKLDDNKHRNLIGEFIDKMGA